MISTAPALASLFESALAAFRSRLLERLPVIWQAALAATAPPAPVVRLWNLYNEGYLLRGPGDGAPLLAIDLVVPKQLDPEARQQLLALLPPLAALLVTHRHGDHLDAEVVARLLEAGTPVYLPGDAGTALRERLGLDTLPAGVRLVHAGDTFTVGGAEVVVHATDHRSAKVAESVAYELRLAGTTLLHAADHRAFDAPVPTWPRQADLVILSFYHQELDAVDDGTLSVPGLADMRGLDAWATRFQWNVAAGLIDMAERLSPRQVLIGHLYELGHEPEKLWRFLDVGVVREALFARAPHIAVRSLAPGESLLLLPHE